MPFSRFLTKLLILEEKLSLTSDLIKMCPHKTGLRKVHVLDNYTHCNVDLGFDSYFDKLVDRSPMCHLVDIYSSYFQAECIHCCCIYMISSGLPRELQAKEDRALNRQLWVATCTQ